MRYHFIMVLFVVILPTVAWAERPSLLPPQHIGPPKSEHAPTNRAFQGIPSMAIAPGGRLWANWYAGVTPGEDHNNYVAMSTSADGGATWTEVLSIDPDGSGSVRCFDPELWVSPDKRLFCFWAQMEKHRNDAQLGVWYIETNEPDAANPKWSAPQRIADGVMMCKPVVLTSGEWVLPISTWREHDYSAQMFVSIDNGQRWSLRGACQVPVADRVFDEHMIVERKDGSLWLLVRTKYGIGESVSRDRGKTWPELKPSAVSHTSSRFFIRRLESGNLLLVKHGPINSQSISRSHLTAFVSFDDGFTWGDGLQLDERYGVSYPDGQQARDGLIRIIYDFSRTGDRNILLASFREDDVIAGKQVSPDFKLKQLVCKASGGHEKNLPKPSATKKPNDNADGKPLDRKISGTLACAGIKPEPFLYGATLFVDRTYVAADLPDMLKGAHFLPIKIEGSKAVTCTRAGMVYFLTPAADRNTDSEAKKLQQVGFEKVALPEVPLFDPKSPSNFCTLYQKKCAVGETFDIGKWAVPVYFP